ncbi:ABC transporter ATP-binding protein [Marinobacterium arenosum]|uniref:ABC transporter ATP-binding protein n=1 Tax=Marinobacterium arenosum TaxID=2862496 RepID=UPI001C98C239|nr:ABC transporter ATP-binding protein [Marinobacterium arenosum]MBY4676741.1 ABC transporter ATP-binding protein [Marinobacterium arenosum]
MEPLLQVESLSCAYEQQLIVQGIDFSVARGEIACLLGPSGCGKTTVLRAVAGFNPVQAGSIRMAGEVVSDEQQTLVPEARQMGMVFQDYALFPHLSVADNISFGLRGLSGAQKRQRVTEMLALVRLPDLSDRYPHELSGGQQQRVALARALAPKPKLLLMDEPFSNLDTDLRTQLSLEVRDILKAQGIAAIVVTHDQQEAFAIGDQVGILADGRLQQWGTPQELYHQPVNPLVAGFVGKGELFAGNCVTENQVETELGLLEFAEPFCQPIGKAVELFIRPSDLTPVAVANGSGCAEVVAMEFMGANTRYQLQMDNGRAVEAECGEPLPIRVGDRVGLQVKVHRPIAFDR